MLPAYRGRINRKSFILGNMIGLAALGFAALIYIVPLAIIDIVVNGSGGAGTAIFKVLYGLFIIPAIFYFFFFTVLFVRRLHDIGLPGMLILWSFIILMGAGRVVDIWIFNLIGLAIVFGICILPGQKNRNNFGPKPPKKFKLEHLTIKF